MADGTYSIPPAPGGDTLPQRGLGEIISSAFQIYGRNAAQLIVIVAIIVVPLSIIGFLLSHYAFAATTKTVVVGGQSIKEVQPRSFGLFILAALVAAAISVIITALLQAALLRAGAQASIGDPVDVDASYRWGLRRFGSVLLVSILVGIAVAIGFILLIIPGIIALVFLSVAVPAVVVEDRRGTAAMRRSYELARNHFWHALGVIVVAALIAGVVSAILSALGGHNAVLGAIFGIIAQVIVAPFSALVSVLLYLDLRARHESLTIAGLRTELSAAP